MKAICIHAIAPKGCLKDEFKIEEFPLPEPAEGQIRVTVEYAAVNIDDIRIAEGRFPVPGQAVYPSEEKPYIPGHDFAGVVDAVGAGVSRLKIGDRVYGHTPGSWSQFCLAEAETTGVVPSAWSLQQAVSYVMGAAVAKAAIDKLGDFKGKIGLIIGASGSIGNIALQYLVQHGATVWAVCSGRNENAMSVLGAKKVIDYTQAPFDEQILRNESKVDFVIDFVGGKETEHAAYRVLKADGDFVTAVGPVNFSQDIDVSTWGMIKTAGYLAARIITPRFIRPKYSFAIMPPKPDFTVPPLGDGIEALVDSEYALDRAGIAQAIDRVMSHRARGKVILKMGGESATDGSRTANRDANESAPTTRQPM